MSGGKYGFPNHAGEDIVQPLAQDHYGDTRVTLNNVDQVQRWEQLQAIRCYV